MWWLLAFPAIIVFLAIIFYYFSVQSRKLYRCPQCGEKIRVEYMRATRCNICGVPLKQENMQ